MIRRYTVALMQMDTQNDKGKNLETACAWIDEHGKITGIVDAKKLTKEQLGLMMTGTEACELGLDKSMASEKKEEQA